MHNYRKGDLRKLSKWVNQVEIPCALWQWPRGNKHLCKIWKMYPEWFLWYRS